MDTIQFKIKNIESSQHVDILINGKSLEDIVGKEKCEYICSIIYECYEFKEGSCWGWLCSHLAYTLYTKEHTVRLLEEEFGLFDFEFERKQFEKAIVDARNQDASVREEIANEKESLEKLYEDEMFDVFHKTTIKVGIPWWNNASLIEEIVYQTQEKFYIIVNKQNNERYLFHFESNTFTDTKNSHPMITGRDVFKNSRGLIIFFINELNKKPESYQKHFYLGTYYFAINNYDEAISHYKKVIEYQNNFEYNVTYLAMNHIIYPDMGMAYYNLEDYRNANIYFQEAILYNPDEQEIHSKLGITSGMIGEYKKEIDRTSKA